MVSYTVRVVRRAAELSLLEDAWTGLLREAPGATVFASYQWNAAWWRHFGGKNRLCVVTVWSSEGRLVGVAPLMLSRVGPLRRLQFIGSGLSDYGDFLVHPRFEQGVVGAVIAFLRSRRRMWDLGDLGEIPAHSPLPGYLRSRSIPGLHFTVLRQTPCPFIDLPSSWESYVSSLARKRRYYVSSFPRKFMREHSGRVDVIRAGAEVRDAVKIFHSLHMSRWAGRDDEISSDHRSPAFLLFLQEACASLAGEGWLRVMVLRAGEEPVASSLNFLLHDRWSAYMKGFAPTWSSARPGTVLDSLRIGRAIEEGAEKFDFGRGDEAYKSGYGLQVAWNIRVLLGSDTVRSLLGYRLMLARVAYKNHRQGGEPAADHDD